VIRLKLTHTEMTASQYDYGVSVDGVPFVRVKRDPSQGQYVFNDFTSVYTFNSSDVGLDVVFDERNDLIGLIGEEDEA